MSFVWSWSAIECFEQCPKKFYHQYILREKEPPSPALLKGREDHKNCEDFLNGKIDTPKYPIAVPVKRQAQGKKLMVEAKFGLNGAVEPTGFFDDRVWGRGAADVLILDYPSAVLIDWKTGKIQEGTKYWKGPSQLTILALFAFKHFPRIDKITAMNIYLEHNTPGQPFTFLRSQESQLWAQIMPRIQRVEDTVQKNSYCMMPGPLCGYCPVKTCPNNRS